MKKEVVIAIIAEGDKYLLISSKKDFGKYSGYYYPPGGHIDPGEDEESALQRELKEELNLTIKPLEKIAVTDGDVKDQQTHWWKCAVVEGILEKNDDELHDAGFFTEKEMSQMNIWPATNSFFNTYIFKKIN